jgi:hypothetical protein
MERGKCSAEKASSHYDVEMYMPQPRELRENEVLEFEGCHDK